MGYYLTVIIWVCYGYHLESDRERLDTASSLARWSRMFCHIRSKRPRLFRYLTRNCLNSADDVCRIGAYLPNHILLADAEAGEDGGKDFAGGDLTCDLAESIEGIVEIEGKEFAAETRSKAFIDTGKGFIGTAKGFVMTDIADKHAVGMCCEACDLLFEEREQGSNVVVLG